MILRLVYLAGCYRAQTQWRTERNVRRVEEFAVAVAELGAMPLAPHSLTRFFGGVQSDAFWLAGTLEILRRCDAVLVVGDFADSQGTKDEIAEAERLAIPVFYDVDEVRRWLEDQKPRAER